MSPRLPLIKTEVVAPIGLTKKELLLGQMSGRLKNLRPLMIEGIAPALNRMLLKHWKSEGSAFGHQWAPLEAATIARKTRKGTVNHGILHDTEHLFKLLFAARTTDSRLKSIPGGLRLAANTAVYYAVFHQVGTQFMASREVIPDPLPPSFIRECKAIARNYILTGNIQGVA